MEARDRVIGPIASGAVSEPEATVVDSGNLIRKLVLFERVIVESIGLQEFPLLVQKFSYDGVRKLMESRRLRVLADALTIGQIAQFPMETRAPHPPDCYEFAAVRIHDHKEYVHNAMQVVNGIGGLGEKQSRKLRGLIADSLVTLADDRGQLAVAQLNSDLKANLPILRLSVAVATKREFDKQVPPEDIVLTPELVKDNVWRVTSNLATIGDLDGNNVLRAIERGLLGVGGLNLRLEAMQSHDAISGFRHDELPLMEEKFEQLVRDCFEDAQLERFDRVIELVGLPDVDPDPAVQDVDMPRLLEIMSGAEVREFRQWLRATDHATDEEIAAAIHPAEPVKPGETLRVRI